MKILIIKLAARGDVLRTTSILYGLKEKYRNNEIYWLTEKESIPLLVNNVYINKVLSLDKKTAGKLKNEFFDIVINLDEDFEACKLTSELKTKKLIGFYLENNKIIPTPTAKEWYGMSALGKRPQNDILKKANKKTYQQIMFEILDIKPKISDITYRLNKSQKQYAKDFVRRFNLDLSKDIIIGLNTGSGGRWPGKMLSVDKTAKLAEELYKRLNAKIILFGGKEEYIRNNEITALANVPIINPGVGNDLFEFPALISLCDLFITSDSLGMHLAITLKRKIIAFFGPTSPNEIELYNLGEKIIPKKGCICCYKTNCNATNFIYVEDIFTATKKLLKKPSLSIVITAFKEPNVNKAIESFIKQDIKYPYELLVACPDKETKSIVDKYSKKYQQVKHFPDPGKGKSFALNLIFKYLKDDILIFTDGDVFVNSNSVNEIVKQFKNPLIGCIGGRVKSLNSKNNMLGYWSHLLADAGAHNIRKESAKTGFLECSAYLFAFRNNIIKEIPLDVAEDAVIPYIFWEKGYNISYAENAMVYVKNPLSLRDWIKQRKRTAKAHETLDKYVDTKTTPRVKTFTNEIKKGFFWALKYPKNLKEYYWTILLFPARFYLWLNVFYDTKFRKKNYQDAWERVQSTK